MAEWTEPPIPDETPIDPSGLKVDGVTSRAELNALEAENIRSAIVKYLASKPSHRTAPFDFDWCAALHREMYGNVWKWAGQIRTKDLNIGIAFHLIRDNVAWLLEDLHSWTGFKTPLIEQAARLHYRAVHIHPFENGNGRWSRLLANIWLRRNSHPIIDWPEAVIGTASEIRGEYIAAIKAADGGDFDPLLKIHELYVERRL